MSVSLSSLSWRTTRAPSTALESRSCSPPSRTPARRRREPRSLARPVRHGVLSTLFVWRRNSQPYRGRPFGRRAALATSLQVTPFQGSESVSNIASKRRQHKLNTNIEVISRELESTVSVSHTLRSPWFPHGEAPFLPPAPDSQINHMPSSRVCSVTCGEELLRLFWQEIPGVPGVDALFVAPLAFQEVPSQPLPNQGSGGTPNLKVPPVDRCWRSSKISSLSKLT